MSQGGGRSTLTKQVNLSGGKISATVLRQGSAVSGQGGLLQITFKAIATAERANIHLLSAAPGPNQDAPVRLSQVGIGIR
jgi:general secretion pathway protein D